MNEATEILALEQCVCEMQEELVAIRRNYLAYTQPGESLKPMIAVNIRSHAKSAGENIIILAGIIQKLKEFGK